MEFMRDVEKTFEENMSHYLTWKIEFSEEIDYSLQSTATRVWKCCVLVIVYDYDVLFADTLCDMARYFTTGWCKLEVQLTKLKLHSLLQLKKSFVKDLKLKCGLCSLEFGSENEKFYICIKCEPVKIFCVKCGNKNISRYREYFN